MCVCRVCYVNLYMNMNNEQINPQDAKGALACMCVYQYI